MRSALRRPRVVSEILKSQATDRPCHQFLQSGGDWMTYTDVDRAADVLAGGLHEIGVGPGDRVALLAATREELIKAFYAIARLGAVAVPLNIYLKGDFLRFQLTDSAATVLIADAAGTRSVGDFIASTDVRLVVTLDEGDTPGLSALPVVRYADVASSTAVAPDPGRRPDDLLTIGYTSGTTGNPKGCMLSNGYYSVMPWSYLDAGWFGEDDRLFTILPFYNGGGHALLNMVALVLGVPTVFEPEFHASTFLDRARMEKATVLFAPGMASLAVLAQPPRSDDADNPFRLASFVPMPPAKQAEFAARFDVPVVQGTYGQQECVPVAIAPVGGPAKPGSSGTPVWCYEVAIHDDDDHPVASGEVGEIVVRPRVPNAMFSGYWRNPEATVAAFRQLWHHTGDLGSLDEDGYLTFSDRKKDSLRRRGINISSVEVETVLLEHPDLAGAAVYAVPSELTEDEVMFAVVPREPDSLDAESFFAFCRDRLPFYAVPRYVSVRSELPANALGRVMKHVLRAEGAAAATWDMESMGLVVDRAQRRG